MQPDQPRGSAQSGRYALKATDSLRIQDYHPEGRSKIWNKNENDNKLNYDKVFKPAYLFFHKGANPVSKTALDSKDLSQTEKEPSLWQAGLRIW